MFDLLLDRVENGEGALDLFLAIYSVYIMYTIYTLYSQYLQDFRKHHIPGSVCFVILFFVDGLYADRRKGAHSRESNVQLTVAKYWVGKKFLSFFLKIFFLFFNIKNMTSFQQCMLHYHL